MPDPEVKGPDTSYPRLEASAPAVVTRPYEQRTWAGSKERLIGIQNLLQTVLEDAYEKSLASLDFTNAESYETRRRLEELRNTHRLIVTVRDRAGRWEQQGELSTILATVELDEIESIRMASGHSLSSKSGPRVVVTLRDVRSLYLKAVEAEVSGTDQTWVTGVKDQLATVLIKDLPTWDVMRRPWVTLAVGWLLAVGIQVSVVVATSPNSAQDIALYAAVVVVSAYLSFMATMKLVQRTLPAFEVVPVGGKSLGGRRLTVLGAFGAFVLGNVILPIVLSFWID